MKYISILGSTGSIGTQTVEIMKEQKDLKAVALTAGKNIRLLEEQIRLLKPEYAAVWEEKDAKALKTAVADISGLKIGYGMDGLVEAATYGNAEILVTAVVGMIGIRPTIAAIRAGKNIALANKETLVTAGHLIMPLAKEAGVSILPVDSEHSAIFQSLNGEDKNRIAKIHLTASGGPFRGKRKEELEHVTLADALKHPNWSMGRKVTIDSATMVNKGLEVMEAGWLFGVGADRIHVVVHPQSVIHSMVEYEDGAVIAQLGTPDMRLPIQYALYYPHRRPLSGKRLDFFALQHLDFEKPDTETFQGLALAFQAMERGGNMPTVFNAANEKAVAMFIAGEIGFLDIARTIRMAMEQVAWIADPDFGQILATEQEVYELIRSGR